MGGRRPDEAVARELLRALEPLAVEAAIEAENRIMHAQAEQRRIRELELQQAQYEATLAERRYAACDPQNRLIAAKLESSWESALARVQSCEQQLHSLEQSHAHSESPDLTGLSEDLQGAWDAPSVTMRARQQMLRTLINEIIVDVDDDQREIIMIIHWHGGQHSELRLRKPRSGEHGCITSEDAVAVIGSMAGKWSDEHIAAALNRMGLRTGQGKTWTAQRVGSVRKLRGIHAYRSGNKDGQWLTMSEAARKLGVNNHRIRRLIHDGILSAEQVVPGAPYQIRAHDLENQRIIDAAARTSRPCRTSDLRQDSMFSDT